MSSKVNLINLYLIDAKLQSQRHRNAVIKSSMLANSLSAIL
jgi:hypothetical protein